MNRMPLARRTRSAAVTLLGLSLLATAPVAAEEVVFKDAADYCAEVDGADASDARFFVTDPKGRLLVELPSLSTSVLIALKPKKLVILPPSSIKREDEPSKNESGDGEDNGGNITRLLVEVPADAEVSSVSMDGLAWSFQIGESDVRILKASDCYANVAPAIPVAGEALVLRACDTYCAEINGAYAPDVRFFSTDPKGRILVDLPSLSASALLTLKAQKLVALPRSSFKIEADKTKARLVEQVSPEAPVSSLSMSGPAWSFKIDDSEVRILKASKCLPVVAPLPPNEPVTDDLKAKRCLHQSTRSVQTAGCTNGVFLRNSCDVPVVAVVQTTQHLFSGTLPQTSTVVIPPRVEYPPGCVWSSGAMGPANYDILAAAFARRQSTGH